MVKAFLHLHLRNRLSSLSYNQLEMVYILPILENSEVFCSVLDYNEDLILEVEEKFLYYNLKFRKLIKINYILQELQLIFDSFWEFEFRSSNFSTKIFLFYNIWHNSATRISFYDFLLKTKLLKDEKQMKRDYDTYVRKVYRKTRNRDRKRLARFWRKLDLEYY